jgi:glyoxylase-like metal-dependent hydrolase (beta-lactamase superfamily II)
MKTMNIFPPLKNLDVTWDVLVFGHLFWNRYFGETSDNPPRSIPSTCSSVLIRGKDSNGKPYCLIVDPTTRRSPEEYYFDLNRRTGLRPELITHCFTTHNHFDHWHGLRYFPNALWFTAPGNRILIDEAVKQAVDTKKDPGDGQPPEIDVNKVTEVSGEFLPGVWALPLPGHTRDLHGVAFMSEGRKILMAADAVMTGYHFRDRATEFQSDEIMKKQGSATIENIAESFDIVVPGHDNMIISGSFR